MADDPSILVYLDTNVYSRPFDDQTQPDIQREANAFVEIISEVEAGRLILLCSDILEFEVHNILSEDKRSKVECYLELCDKYIQTSDDVSGLGKRIQSHCHIRPRDALHVAAALVGQARYFLSCDRKVTEMKQARCYRRLGKPYRKEYFSAMNPILFVEKMKKGEIG